MLRRDSNPDATLLDFDIKRILFYFNSFRSWEEF